MGNDARRNRFKKHTMGQSLMHKITQHSQEDFEKMRKAGKLAKSTLDYVEKFVKAGVTTLELNDICHEYITSHGGICAPLNYKGFPKSICTSVNHVICHGIPNEKTILKNGDIINIDVTVIVEEFHGDTSRMYTVGPISPLAKKLIETTKQALQIGIDSVKLDGDIMDIGIAIENFINKSNCKFSIVREYCGHGIGKIFHADPHVIHYDMRSEGFSGVYQKIIPGMFFTIEPMINVGVHAGKLLNDGWTVVTKDRSLSAQFEHTIGIHENGKVEIFTA